MSSFVGNKIVSTLQTKTLVFTLAGWNSFWHSNVEFWQSQVFQSTLGTFRGSNQEVFNIQLMSKSEKKNLPLFQKLSRIL